MPVRGVRESEPVADSEPQEVAESRRFAADGVEWLVRIVGRTMTGRRPDPGALLMQLLFYRISDPEKPRRKLLTVDRPLEALYEEDLQEMLRRAKPVKVSTRR